MATIEQTPPPRELEVDVVSPLNNLLARAYTLNWEAIFYVALFGAAVLTRFVNLGDRVMSHDESLHTTYSFNLWKKGEYQHTPLMHGPVLFHMTALMYFLFGDSDFSARLYPAILGVILVLMPKLLFERWLGKRGAMVASIMLLISPMVLFHNRYIREDTPSIFFTLIMVYAIFAYVDGARPRQVRWLIVLSAATLLSLASKEVAFMYIAIFGSVLTLFWIFQVIQGTRAGLIRPIAAQVIAAVIGLAIVGGLSLGLGGFVSNRLAESGGTAISGRLIAIPIALALLVLAFVLIRPLQRVFRRISQHGNSVFKLMLAGIVLGTIAALAMTCFLNIIQPKDIWKVAPAPAVEAGQPAPAPAAVIVDQALLNRLIIWVTLMVMVLALVVMITALVRFSRSPRLPWADIAILVLVAVLTCTALVVVEERSRNVPNVSTDARKGVDIGTGFHNEWIALTWVIGVAAVAGILALRFATSFFEDMKRYPVFDVLMILGTLVLPWLSAIPIFLAGYPLDDSNVTNEVINAGILGTAPFVLVAAVAGLCWNPAVWLACAATFYSIFAFFFTTIFSNINGMFTGLVGSLGYWLAQQGVRRGSQPQYYYLLVELPVYEYLPVIGAAIAGVVGLLGLWRFRAERIAEADQFAEAARAAEAALADQVAEAAKTVEAALIEEHEKHKRDVQLNSDGELVAVPLFEPNIESQSAEATGSGEATQVNASGETLFDGEQGAEIVDGEIPTPEPTDEERRRVINDAEWIDRVPFLGFVGYWAVLILMAFTMAGEKMPWLTTHLTIPLIFLTGWYVGSLLDGVQWEDFRQRSWALVGLAPILVVALVNVVGPFMFDNGPFQGLSRDNLLKTFTWMGAVLLAGLVIYGIYRIWRHIGTRQTLRITGLGAFVLLAVLTARTAWTAAFINYDYATEFLVYAHAAPANKTVMSVIEDISRRTTDGLNIKVAYDNEVSWPGSWYFRNYPPGSFKGDMTGATDLDQYVAVVVGDGNNSKIQNQLADKFYEVKYARLWWPMQDYFDLNVNRVDNVFSGDANLPEGWIKGSGLREGLWDIWWNRDYTTYGKVVKNDEHAFDPGKWPVTDWMHFYVRKDVAAQIWDMGTGTVKVSGLPEDPFKALRCDTCAANSVISGTGDAPGLLNHPRGIAVGPDGNLYVADSQNARISIFTADGQFVRQFGVASTGDPNQTNTAPGGTFREPWSVAVGQDGTIYVADTWNHRVQVFDKTGKFLRMWGQYEQVAAGQSGKPDGFWGPRDIAVDDQNRVYVADTGNKRIRVYDAQGNFLLNIGQGGAGDGQLNEPVGIAINNQTGEIFVADTWNKRIDVFDLTGAHHRSWSVQAWGKTTDTGSRPYLALDKTGTHLFVTDPDAARVLVFDTNGTALVSFGNLGNSASYNASTFGALGGITIDNIGRVFLADSASGRILRFSMESFPGLVPAEIAPGGQENNGQGQPGQIGTPAATSEVF